MSNNYDKMSDSYAKSHGKPDKKYSMVPTALKILGSLKNKIVVDVGCGDGFFTKEFAKTAKFVYGIDNSKEQIKKARKNPKRNIKYILEDMNEYDYGGSDVIFAPFVLNYPKTKEKLLFLFKNVHVGLNKKGIFSGIVDVTNKTNKNMKKFGSIKKISKLEDEEKLIVELYTNNILIATILVTYYTKKTIEKLLKKVGFKNIKWHAPIISKKGLRNLGKDFWKGYIKDCDLGYFTAIK